MLETAEERPRRRVGRFAFRAPVKSTCGLGFAKSGNFPRDIESKESNNN
jgi:hypothetical protein